VPARRRTTGRLSRAAPGRQPRPTAGSRWRARLRSPARCSCQPPRSSARSRRSGRGDPPRAGPRHRSSTRSSASAPSSPLALPACPTLSSSVAAGTATGGRVASSVPAVDALAVASLTALLALLAATVRAGRVGAHRSGRPILDLAAGLLAGGLDVRHDPVTLASAVRRPPRRCSSERSRAAGSSILATAMPAVPRPEPSMAGRVRR
jgi:hypothetical protein